MLDFSAFTVLGSNIRIFSPSFLPEKHGAYNADVSVVIDAPVMMTRPNGTVSTSTITNLIIVVEVQSDTTQNDGFSTKLAHYKTVESLEQIIFVSQKMPYVSIYLKKAPHQWLNLDFVSLNDQVPVHDQHFGMDELCRGIL